MQKKEAIFQEILDENKDKIYRICIAYLYDKSEVEDLFQDILLNIWNNLHRFRNEAKISTWVYRISVNTALLYNKKNKAKQKLFVKNPEVIQQIPSESKLTEIREREQAIKHLVACINQLEKQDRLIMSLLLEGTSYKEIADIMGTTTNYVGVRINRAKKKLNNMIKVYNDGN